MCSMIVVAHKFPVETDTQQGQSRCVEASGGLATALRDITQEPNNTWVAACTAGLTPQQLSTCMPCHVAPVALQQQLYGGFYWHTANGVLWPLYHSLPQYAEPLCQTHWQDYVQVNRAFAQAAHRVAQPSKWVWIHDYQLSLVPAQLRHIGCSKKIAFFLHIPFPPWEILRTIPSHKQLLEGMLGADTIGFHTRTYQTHFLQCVSQALQAPTNTQGAVQHQNRWIQTVTAPLGVAVHKIQRQVKKRRIQRAATKLRQHINSKHFVLGIDRLDYTKGIDAKLRIVEATLQQHPSMRNNFKLLQLCVPTRQRLQPYRELKTTVQQLATRVNTQFGHCGHCPVTLLHGSLPYIDLLAWYAAADMILVTPWRDGMNLVAQEYVAARAPNAGSLILSRHAGAAQQILQDATLIDPKQTQESGQRLAQELTKPDSQKAANMQQLLQQLTQYDINSFTQACLPLG
ncbi:MAG: trehalose-6-phosphate synthase [Myxococcota bacterium]